MANIKLASSYTLSERGIKYQNDSTRSIPYFPAGAYDNVSVPAEYEVASLESTHGVLWHFGGVHIPGVKGTNNTAAITSASVKTWPGGTEVRSSANSDFKHYNWAGIVSWNNTGLAEGYYTFDLDWMGVTYPQMIFYYKKEFVLPRYVRYDRFLKGNTNVVQYRVTDTRFKLTDDTPVQPDMTSLTTPSPAVVTSNYSGATAWQFFDQNYGSIAFGPSGNRDYGWNAYWFQFDHGSDWVDTAVQKYEHQIGVDAFGQPLHMCRIRCSDTGAFAGEEFSVGNAHFHTGLRGAIHYWGP